LIAEAVDQRTWRQFVMMLSKTDLHPRPRKTPAIQPWKCCLD
jgi:hypothetical protein